MFSLNLASNSESRGEEMHFNGDIQKYQEKPRLQGQPCGYVDFDRSTNAWKWSCQVQANVGINALDSMYYTDPSPLPLPRKTQFNRSDLVRNRVQYGSTTPLAIGPAREIGFGEKEDRLMQVEFTRDGYTGKVSDWAISGDAPKWMNSNKR